MKPFPAKAVHVPQKTGSRDVIVVNDTFWGYIIGPGSRQRWRASQGEAVAVMVSLVFGGFAFSQWIAPGQVGGVDLLPFKLAGTAIFFLFAAMLYLMAKKGMSSETQIDLQEREIRIVRRNRADESMTLESYPFNMVVTAYIRRSKHKSMYCNLCIETVGRAVPVVLCTAPERQLEPVLERLRADVLDMAKARKPDAPAPGLTCTRGRVATAFAAR